VVGEDVFVVVVPVLGVVERHWKVLEGAKDS
jgi:hypothetical protein